MIVLLIRSFSCGPSMELGRGTSTASARSIFSLAGTSILLAFLLFCSCLPSTILAVRLASKSCFCSCSSVSFSLKFLFIGWILYVILHQGIGCTKITKARNESSINGNMETRSYLEKKVTWVVKEIRGDCAKGMSVSEDSDWRALARCLSLAFRQKVQNLIKRQHKVQNIEG